MNKKIIFIIFVGICVCMLVYMVVVNTVFNKNEEIVNEYTPEVEISDDELRKTIVTLYFENVENNSIGSEARFIDSKELLRDPYTTLVGMLINGPKDSKLKSIIPTGTKVMGAVLNGNCVTINLSDDFIKNAPEDVNQKSDMIYSIINTLTELKEVEEVKFLINGEEVQGFDENSISLKSTFVRKTN